jgi:hypothetical protein
MVYLTVALAQKRMSFVFVEVVVVFNQLVFNALCHRASAEGLQSL